MGGKRERYILVVDDDDLQVRLWKRILSEMGYDNIKGVCNPLEAKKLISLNPNCVLLISDVVMPGMNGYELARFVRTLVPDCSVILTTAYKTSLARFNLLRPRFHLVHKPYMDLTELQKFVKHVVNGDNNYDDIDDDAFVENIDYPDVTEWTL